MFAGPWAILARFPGVPRSGSKASFKPKSCALSQPDVSYVVFHAHAVGHGAEAIKRITPVKKPDSEYSPATGEKPCIARDYSRKNLVINVFHRRLGEIRSRQGGTNTGLPVKKTDSRHLTGGYARCSDTDLNVEWLLTDYAAGLATRV